jgi:hypothetical protein
MITIIGYAFRESKEGKQFIALQLQGDMELVQSQETGRFYATARKCSIPCTFDEPTVKALVGTKMPGSIEQVSCEPYEYTVPETGDVITLAHTYTYVPEGKQSAEAPPKLQVA